MSGEEVEDSDGAGGGEGGSCHTVPSTVRKSFRYCKRSARGGSVKLDLLYEFQPKIKPWTQPHPYGQRDAEQRTYDEAIREIQYADKLGFNTVWVVEHH